MVPLLVPELVPETRVRNDPLVTEADQLSVPPPLFDTLIDWPRGLPPPATPEKDSDVGDALILGVWAINPGRSSAAANKRTGQRASWRIIN
jgi:hypothetical protein